MAHIHFGIIVILSILATLVAGNRSPPKSALKWISKNEAKKLPNGFWNANLVRPGIDGNHKKKYGSDEQRRLFCRAEIEGCQYPGEAWYATGDNDGGYPFCRLITKTKVYKSRRNFQLLYNPGGAAKYTWLPWKDGTGNLNFPLGVVKSDAQCNLMLARYNDRDENAFVDSQGYVYYQLGPGEKWYWDNNEYDLLVERSAKKIEVLDLEYGDPLKKHTEKYEGQSVSSETYLTNRNFDKDSTQTTELQQGYTSSRSWSHSVEFGVSVGVEVEVTTPGKALLGGAAATYGFEASVSYNQGWGSGKTWNRNVKHGISESVPPRSRVKVKMIIMQNIEDVPYTAKYRVTYDDDTTQDVYDKGVMKNAFLANSEVVVFPAESLDLKNKTLGLKINQGEPAARSAFVCHAP